MVARTGLSREKFARGLFTACEAISNGTGGQFTIETATVESSIWPSAAQRGPGGGMSIRIVPAVVRACSAARAYHRRLESADTQRLAQRSQRFNGWRWSVFSSLLSVSLVRSGRRVLAAPWVPPYRARSPGSRTQPEASAGCWSESFPSTALVAEILS